MKEFQTEPGNRVTLMHRLTVVAFEALGQIVGEQLDQQIQIVGFKIACRDTVDRKNVLDFLDVTLAAPD